MLPHNEDIEKNKNEKYAKLLGSTYGQIAFASFLITAVSGVFLAVPFDINNPFDSISLILLTNPAANLFRNVHYWSAQFFLVFSFLHLWDHLRLSTERDVKKGVWLRLTISIIAVFYVMLSGFILRGDADSIQAKTILTTLLNKIPLIGAQLSYSVLGSAKDFQIPYIHHIATATIFLWFITVEHSKLLWPKMRLVIYLLPVFVVAGFLFPPGLHDNLSTIVKGPWYFLGLQELLHYLSYPSISIVIVFLFLVLIYLLRSLNEKKALLIKRIVLVSSIAYLFLTITGLFFRGENWQLVMPWDHKITNEININSEFNLSTVSIDKLKRKKIPVILGRREGCLFCHDKTAGFSPAHNPEAIGCASCHKGDVFSLDKASAHKGLILIPGNLQTSKETCGTPQCHPDVPERVDNTIMATLTGIVSVDRYIFGETDSPHKFNRITSIKHSPADKHLRNLCSSCHLGKVKDETGPVTQTSRGGGCNACHLNYSSESEDHIGMLKSNSLVNSDSLKEFVHPKLSVRITNNHCFGCHSRSGRISTNYEGWSETELTNIPAKDKSDYRQLDDERIFTKQLPDIHYEYGMECIDCHPAKEVMGDGSTYFHKEDQVKIQCVDCHVTGNPRTVTEDNVDIESQKIITLRNYSSEKKRFLVTQKKDYVLTNTYVDSLSGVHLINKNSGKDLIIKKPLAVCTGNKGHEKLSCSSCHTSWASNCISCHTEYKSDIEAYDNLTDKDTKGGWVENASGIGIDTPALGIIVDKDKNGKEEEVIDNFIPGMIINIKNGKNNSFKRSFAPAFPHTIRKESRGCKSCHNNPSALGYGSGKLEYTKAGKWRFTPEYELAKTDGLPRDAWIGFLKKKDDAFATRTNVRPFSVAEQRKILEVGACLTCHTPESKPMRDYLKTGKRPRITAKCIVPDWN